MRVRAFKTRTTPRAASHLLKRNEDKTQRMPNKKQKTGQTPEERRTYLEWVRIVNERRDPAELQRVGKLVDELIIQTQTPAERMREDLWFIYETSDQAPTFKTSAINKTLLNELIQQITAGPLDKD